MAEEVTATEKEKGNAQSMALKVSFRLPLNHNSVPGSQIEKRTIRRKSSMTTNWRVVNGNGTKPEDPVDSVINTGKDVLHVFAAEIDRAVNKSMAIREAETFGTPGRADVKVRREGFLRRENPEDRKRFEAKKANRDRGVLTADHLKLLGGFAASGEKFVLDVVTNLTQVTDDLPDELRPVGEVLTNASTKILSKSYIEGLQFLAERGFQEVDQATQPGQQQQQ
jgi:hypothetical protein